MGLYSVEKGKTYPCGASKAEGGIQFSSVTGNSENAGVVLMHEVTGEKIQIPFSMGKRVGNISSVLVKNIDYKEYTYNFYDESGEYTDIYAKRVYGNEEFGVKDLTNYSISGGFDFDEFDWEDDEPLCIPFDESILYCMHVRSFTAHASSGVKHKGTFAGITEKIPYLKNLGITGLELLPAYEFEEYVAPAINNMSDVNNVTVSMGEPKLNYWGFKKAFYFAPKTSYSFSKDPVWEFKQMIKKLHENNIEVIMQFYFPDEFKQGFILEVLKYWITEYHIDGIHLKGNKIPITLICTEPLFANTKIFYDYIPANDIYTLRERPLYKNLCVYSDEFMYKVRRFLKGDEDMLKEFAILSKRKPENTGNVNFITNYYGFTLNDLVSYDRKHNEINGENNMDGASCNYSWNCGIEGKTKKPGINALRRKMIKNALASVLLSQGTPVILSGDEFMNSQEGNNNSYCNDNEINYLNWRMNKQSKEIFDFTKFLIEFRKNKAFLHEQYEPSMLDRTMCGFPDLSYHGEEAFMTDFAGYNRHIGMMYATYSEEKKGVEFVYVAYNMYWEDKVFSLPSLIKGAKWKQEFSTASESPVDLNVDKTVKVEQRSVSVFTSFVEFTPKKGQR